MNINWKKILDWSVVKVSRPYEMHFQDIAQYGVDVTYKYHGMKTHVFSATHDRLKITADRLALRNAIRYYLDMRNKIKQ